MDYPYDESTLMSSFQNKNYAKQYMQTHYDNFVRRPDVKLLKESGVTHVRVPMPHWILGDVLEDEPWVDAGGWLYFVRFVSWCREEGIQVWPDLHTAPGPQNGFDNSGVLLKKQTCDGWSKNPDNVDRTLRVVTSIAEQIKQDGLEDVVTGFGVLNEPFVDCDMNVLRKYNKAAMQAVRGILGPNTTIYIGDMFNSTKWNDGWWIDEPNTFLDSHYYHVFAERPRALSPRQHIAYVCEKNYRDTIGCCYSDPPENTKPATGITRMVGEWSAATDTLVEAKLHEVMNEIMAKGIALDLDREIDEPRKEFLKNFVKAQMVAYEAENAGVSSGWFYWTLKMEGGAFAEWDFMRGLREGWIPKIPAPEVSSESLYGACTNIIFQTKDDMSIIHEFPPKASEDPNNWQGVEINDDIVISHGNSLLKGGEKEKESTEKTEEDAEPPIDGEQTRVPQPVKNESDSATIETNPPRPTPKSHSVSRSKSNKDGDGASTGGIPFVPVMVLGFFVYAIRRVFFSESPFHPTAPSFPTSSFQTHAGSFPSVSIGSRIDRSQYQTVSSEHASLTV